MANVSELASALQTLLDTAEVGFPNEKCNVSYWAANLDRVAMREDGVLTDFLPCMVSEISGTYIPIANTKIASCKAVFTILFPLEETTQSGNTISGKDRALLVYEKLARKLIGKTLQVGESTCLFTIDKPTIAEYSSFNSETIDEITNLLHLSTKYFGVMDVTLTFKEFDTNDGYLFGNDIDAYISLDGSNYQKLIRTQLAAGMSADSISEQYLGKNSVESFNSVNALGRSLTFYVKNISSTLMQTLLSDAVDGGNQNRIYYLRLMYGSQALSTQAVIMDSGSFDPPLGGMATITASFKKAWSGFNG